MNVPKQNGANENSILESVSERAQTFSDDRTYIFRGDDSFRGGTIGRAFGPEADEADIQDGLSMCFAKKPAEPADLCPSLRK